MALLVFNDGGGEGWNELFINGDAMRCDAIRS